MSNISNKVKNFYESIKFPNYGEDNLSSIISKGRRNILINQITKEIPSNIKIIETGCGTGQLANFLSATTNNKIIATDLCRNSIQAAIEFNKKYISSDKIQFINADIFENSLEKESADLTFALGWMHHTKNCKLALKEVLSLTKSNGFIIISLYNKIGRSKITLIKLLSKLFGKRIIHFLDQRLKQIKSIEKKNTWILDQYYNVHETRHTYDEIINWCKEFKVTILNFYPSMEGHEITTILEKKKEMSFIERIISQVFILFNSNDGGLFFCVIKKN